MNNIQILELLGMTVLDQNNAYVGEIPYMDNIQFSNSSSKKELQSGPKMSTLYTISSEYKTEVSGSAVMSVDLLTLLFGETPISGTTRFLKNEDKTVSSLTATLAETPVSGGRIIVYNTTGGNKVLLTTGTPASDPTKYSITGKVITVNTAVTSIKVIYDYDKTGIEFAKKAKASPSLKYYAACKYVDLDAKQERISVFEMTNATMSPDFSVQASNADMAKIDIKLDANIDISTGKSWSLKIEA